MKIIHSINDNQIERDIDESENVGIMLANGLGGYAAFSRNQDSRYNGWSVSFGHKVYKILDDLRIANQKKFIGITNKFYEAERIYEGNLTEAIFIPYQYNSLVCEFSDATSMEAIFDIRELYDSRNFGRNYEIFEENGITFVKYTKYKNWMEDKSDTREYEMYVAIKTGDGKIEKIAEWLRKHYEYDQKRNSPPFDRYTYNAVKITGKKMVFSVALDKETARSEAEFVFQNIEELKNNDKKMFTAISHTPRISDKEIEYSYLAAKVSLANLMVQDGKKFGIYAGLPWFFHFWTSDEAISLKSVSKINDKFAKKVLFRDIESINQDGKMYDVVYAKLLERFGLNTDAAGWLFFRAAEMMREGKVDKYQIKERLVSTIESLRKNHMQNTFIISDVGETWMDTFYVGDNHDGARVEIQALTLHMYKLAAEITGDQQYKVWENELRKNVRKSFWNGKVLADGLEDTIISPNIFIAYYVYPELLTEIEWVNCFENALPKLWLEWGGLSTIDKTSNMFFDTHSGESPESYHRGDSWFWINNLAALVLYRLDAYRFGYYINKILEKSSEIVLWSGYLGHISELSSAKEARSEGAWSQAWSAAMYMEAVEEILKNRK